MNMKEDLVSVIKMASTAQPMPSICDLIRREKDQPCSPGTKDYFAASPRIQEFARALVTADKLLKEHTEVAAYYLWERRGRGHRRDLNDWYEAEKQLLQKLHPDLFDAQGNRVPA